MYNSLLFSLFGVGWPMANAFSLILCGWKRMVMRVAESNVLLLLRGAGSTTQKQVQTLKNGEVESSFSSARIPISVFIIMEHICLWPKKQSKEQGFHRSVEKHDSRRAL